MLWAKTEAMGFPFQQLVTGEAAILLAEAAASRRLELGGVDFTGWKVAVLLHLAFTLAPDAGPAQDAKASGSLVLGTEETPRVVLDDGTGLGVHGAALHRTSK